MHFISGHFFLSFDVFTNCSLCGTEVTLFIQCAQFVQVLLKTEPFCKFTLVSAALTKRVISLASDIRSILAVRYFLQPFSLSLAHLARTFHFLFYLSSRLITGHSFLAGNNTPMSWSDWVRCYTHPTPCSLSLLTLLVHSSFLLNWKRTV